MKNSLLITLFLVLCIDLIGQNKLPSGIELIGNATGKTSFLLKDSKDILWKGEASYNISGIRYNNGLWQYKNKVWNSIFTTGIFTDGIEIDTTLFFANYEGVYKYEGGKFTIDYGVTKGTCLESYNHKLMVGSMGLGLFEKTATGFKNFSIQINGISYDSIFCMVASGNELWIGTSNGLVLFDGNKFSAFKLPSIKSSFKLIVDNQRTVFSVQKDVDGKVWVLSRNLVDSLECLYFMQNGTFTSANNYYNSQCISKFLLPYSAKKLALSKDGHVLIGMGWGVLKLTNDSIKNYYFTDNYNTSLKNNGAYSIAYCDKKGSIYSDIFNIGFLSFDNATFSNKEMLYDPILALNTIDINDIKSVVGNTGINFPWKAKDNLALSLPDFITPSIGCASAMFTAAIWMGGTESGSGDLHLAAETYRQIGNDFKPGPIDLVTNAYDSAASSFYNRIWKINRQVIDDFKANRTKPFYVIPKEIMDWPAHGRGNFSNNLAPFMDTDKNGVYEPTKGDYPKIKGDQMLWWVFNDIGMHTETGGQSLGVEVHGSCYAYNFRDLPITDSNYIINRTIFFNYKIINRSENTYNNFYTGVWNDVDLGNYSDDYVGCDTLQNTGFAYNGTNNDIGKFGFGKNPPMLLCKLLNQKMSGFVYYNNNSDPINGNPSSTADFYNYLQSKWQNGNDITFGSNGVGQAKKTKYMYSGKICNDSDWNEKTAFNQPGDRRFLVSTQLPVLGKDSTEEVEFAYILLHDPSKDFLKEGCDLPGKTLTKIQNWYDKNNFPSRPYYGNKVNELTHNQLGLLIYPNPANNEINIKADMDTKEVIEINIFDDIGKCNYTVMNIAQFGSFETTIDIGNYVNGIYLIQIKTKSGLLFGKVIKG